MSKNRRCFVIKSADGGVETTVYYEEDYDIYLSGDESFCGCCSDDWSTKSITMKELGDFLENKEKFMNDIFAKKLDKKNLELNMMSAANAGLRDQKAKLQRKFNSLKKTIEIVRK